MSRRIDGELLEVGSSHTTLVDVWFLYGTDVVFIPF